MLKDLRLDFRGRTFTADALLTQRKLADFLRARGAHFVFTAKGNQPTLLDDLRVFFENRGEPDFREPPALEHGRIESRAIWTTARLNGYLTFRTSARPSSSSAPPPPRSPARPPSTTRSASPATRPIPPTPGACSN